MSIITISTPFNIDIEFQLASFSKRLLAWFLDLVIICLYYYLTIALLLPLFNIHPEAGNSAMLLIVIIPVFLYFPLSEIFGNGQTLGKRLAGIQVVDTNGEVPATSQYLIRWMLSLGNLTIYSMPLLFLVAPFTIIFAMIIYGPDALCMIITRNSQRIGDLAAGTIVIDKHYRTDIHETIYLDVEEDNYTPVFPQVMRLTDRDINGIRNLLDMKVKNRETGLYIQQVVYRIKTVLDIQSSLDEMDFLRQLLQDYNYLTRK